MSSSLSRRHLLRHFALGASSLPMMALAEKGMLPGGKQVYAQDGSPRRMLLISDPFGYHEGKGMGSVGKPGGPSAPGGYSFGNPPAISKEFTLLGLGTPFEPLKQDMVLIYGLEQVPHKDDDLHSSGYKNMFTANDYDIRAGRTSGPSLDVALEQKIGKVTNPALPSLALDVQWGQDHQFFWMADGTPRPTNGDPFDVYEKLFSKLMTGATPGPDPALKARLALRKSVLDVVAKDLGDFKRRLPAEDRLRAEAQTDALRTLESRLSSALNGGEAGGAVAACKKPENFPPKFDLKSAKNHLTLVRLQLSNIMAAFACDSTRIAALNLDAQYGCDFAPINNRELPHTLSHDFRDQHELWRKLHNEEIAKFALALKAIPEGKGSMLDNTVIVIGTDISHGHTHRHTANFVIGGKNMGINVGHWLGFGEGVAANNTRFGGRPHGQMLASISTAMGNPVEYFGARTWRDIDGPGKDGGGGQDNGGNVPVGLLPGLLTMGG